MKKKLLMLGASMLILGNSQISYGAAAGALEDDPSRRMSVPGERVGAALKDQMAREDEAMARHEAARTKALEAAAAAGEPDEVVKREVLTIRDKEEEGLVRVLYKITDADGVEKTKGKDLPRKEEGPIWTEASHDPAGHVSVPRIRVYGEDEEGNRHYVEGEKLGKPIAHVRMEDRGEALENDGDPYKEGGKTYQKKKRKVWYKRVGVDGLDYAVYEQADPVEVRMAPPAAKTSAPAKKTVIDPPKRENTKTVWDKAQKECTVM